MDCLPSMCEEWKSVEKQIEYIQKLSQKPTVIINLRVNFPSNNNTFVCLSVCPVCLSVCLSVWSSDHQNYALMEH